MNKWIRLTGLKLNVSIGIHDFERIKPQPYRLDIGLQIDNSYVTRNDEIEETVNYDALRTRVSDYLSARHFNLQETVIQDVMGICFALDDRVIAASVQTAKTSVYPDCDSVGLAYAATREEWAASQVKSPS